MRYNPRDAFYQKAKREGYRSRAAYKLLELNRRFHIIKPGDLVVDLGAAPGGWLQVAAKLTGLRGKVLGVDLRPFETFNEKNLILLQGDITREETQRKIAALLGAPADCVLSDLAPRLSGIRDSDASRCLELNRTALMAATRLLKGGGSFLVKSFIGEQLQMFTAELKTYFRSVERTRPDATRRGSSEIYFFAKGFQRARES